MYCIVLYCIVLYWKRPCHPEGWQTEGRGNICSPSSRPLGLSWLTSSQAARPDQGSPGYTEPVSPGLTWSTDCRSYLCLKNIVRNINYLLLLVSNTEWTFSSMFLSLSSRDEPIATGFHQNLNLFVIEIKKVEKLKIWRGHYQTMNLMEVIGTAVKGGRFPMAIRLSFVCLFHRWGNTHGTLSPSSGRAINFDQSRQGRQKRKCQISWKSRD